MGVKNWFDFLNKSEIFSRTPDYLSMVKDKNVRSFLGCFFDKSVIDVVPQKTLIKLVDEINKDVRKGIFSYDEGKRKISGYNIMTQQQLNSASHKMFLGIIKDYFGKSAYKTLCERKNINIFNVVEIHVLHQKIFDNFGVGFVNRILNNDLTPQSLMVIKDVLTNSKKMDDFKYYYDFYNKHIGDSQVDFETMVRGWVSHRDLVENIRESKVKLTDQEISALVEVFKSQSNEKNVRDIEGVRAFYKNKDSKYQVDKAALKSKSTYGFCACNEFAQSVLENFFGISQLHVSSSNFCVSQRDPGNMQRYYDIEDMLNHPEMLEGIFSSEEKEMLAEMFQIYKLSKRSDENSFNQILSLAEKYEKKGNYECSKIGSVILSKVPRVFERNMLSTLSRVEDMNQRIKNGEKGLSIDKNPMTTYGKAVSSPVYRLDGADFSFLSTTIFHKGLSNISVGDNFVESWFEFENGTSHISCSYANQDRLSNLEFNANYWNGGERVSYLFEDANIYAMGPGDIWTPAESRLSDVYSNATTKFMRSDEFLKKTGDNAFNEVGISRYDYNGDVRMAGKLIPSAILCSDEITPFQACVAEEFTKYCVENGLKPQGWKMPIVVVNKKRYEEIQDQKARGLITKNSEYFSHKENKSEQNEQQDIQSIKVADQVDKKTVGVSK